MPNISQVDLDKITAASGTVQTKITSAATRVTNEVGAPIDVTQILTNLSSAETTADAILPVTAAPAPTVTPQDVVSSGTPG